MEDEKLTLLNALKEAAETIHYEFCGRGHHRLCQIQLDIIKQFEPEWVVEKE